MVKIGCFYGQNIQERNKKSGTKCALPVQIFVGSRDPYDRKVEGPHLLLRVFETRTLLISNPEHNLFFPIFYVFFLMYTASLMRSGPYD